MVCYCDDFVILCRSQVEAEAALALFQTWMQQHGLRLHPEKTRIVESSQTDCASGFDFLGYRFAGGRRYVRPKSLKALRDKIRQKTGRTRSGSLDLIIAELNPTLRGWFGYFKHAIIGTFRTIDGFVRRRLRAILRKREKRPGYGQGHQDHQRWPNASSWHTGFSPFMKPVCKRANPDEETTNWRAVCGRTARTVRRAGRELFPTPISYRFRVKSSLPAMTYARRAYGGVCRDPSICRTPHPI